MLDHSTHSMSRPGGVSDRALKISGWLTGIYFLVELGTRHGIQCCAFRGLNKHHSRCSVGPDGGCAERRRLKCDRWLTVSPTSGAAVAHRLTYSDSEQVSPDLREVNLRHSGVSLSLTR